MREKINQLAQSYRAIRSRFFKAMEKPVKVLKTIFGYGILTSLFIGGLTLLGYIVAFCIGGEGAVAICSFIKKYIIVFVTYTSTITVLLGLLIMYLSGEVALSTKAKASKKEESSLSEGER